MLDPAAPSGGWDKLGPIVDMIVRRDIFGGFVQRHSGNVAGGATSFQNSAEMIEKVVAKYGNTFENGGQAVPAVLTKSYFLNALRGHMVEALIESNMRFGSKVMGVARNIAKEILQSTGPVPAELVNDPAMPAWHFVPVSQAYVVGAVHFMNRGLQAMSRQGSRYTFSDTDSFLNAGDNYLLGAACLPDDGEMKGHHCWKALDMYIHASGIPYGLLKELEGLAIKYEASGAVMLADGTSGLDHIHRYVKDLLRRAGPVTEANKDKALRPITHLGNGAIVPMELNKLDQTRGITGDPRSEKQLETLKRGLADLKAGFTAVVARESNRSASENPTAAAALASAADGTAVKKRLVDCAYCKKISSASDEFKRCSRCKQTHYCSADCQKKDWKTHKVLCVMLAAHPDEKPRVYSA